MKVLLVTYEYGSEVGGGTGSAINGLVGHIREADKCGQYDVLRIRWRGVANTIVGDLHTEAEGKRCFDVPYLELIKLLITKYRYTVIHFLYHDQYFLLLASRVRKLFGVKIIYSCHSIAKHDVNVRRCEEKNIAAQYRMMQLSDSIHFLNIWCFHEVRSQWPNLIATKNCYIINNGLAVADTVGEAAAENSQRTNKIRNILCLSRWDFGKGVDLAIDAFAAIRPEHPDVRLHVIGKPSDSYDREMAYAAFIDAKLAAMDRTNIEVIGWCDKQTVRGLIDETDLCLVPSMYETFGYAVYETILRRKLTLCADLPCHEGVLQSGEHCLMFRNGDADDLAGKLRALISSPVCGVRLLDADVNALYKKLSWSNVIESYIKLYRDD